jgi:hypothetical protein
MYFSSHSPIIESPTIVRCTIHSRTVGPQHWTCFMSRDVIYVAFIWTCVLDFWNICWPLDLHIAVDFYVEERIENDFPYYSKVWEFVYILFLITWIYLIKSDVQKSNSVSVQYSYSNVVLLKTLAVFFKFNKMWIWSWVAASSSVNPVRKRFLVGLRIL